ncbi:hypothetical protein BDQ17DRAFT_1336618 [Cyathus striatus]|nr:hypothetical protein BDQ17DRAFT_1336618 [Cyathus striatus]
MSTTVLDLIEDPLFDPDAWIGKSFKIIFNALNLPEAGTSRISNFTPLHAANGTSAAGYGFVWFNQKVMLGKVLAVYEKSTTKGARHTWVSDSSNISAVSNIPIQVYEHFVGVQFLDMSISSMNFRAKQFNLLQSAISCVLLGPFRLPQLGV